MSKSREPSRLTLEGFKDSGQLVRMRRKKVGNDGDICGYIEAVGKRWTVIRVVTDNVYWDGFELLRTKHITKARELPVALTGYITRALATHVDVASFPDLSPGADTEEMLRAVGNASSLVCLHIEKDDPDVCFIGRIVRFDEKWFELLQIRPNGTWKSEGTYFNYSEITRVQIGDRYNEGFAKFGDPCPDEVAPES